MARRQRRHATLYFRDREIRVVLPQRAKAAPGLRRLTGEHVRRA